MDELSRRDLLGMCGAAMLGFAGAKPQSNVPSLIARIKDPQIRKGVDDAISKNLLPAATETAYPGFFNISADGGAYGGEATWPGLDSWQMAGAYLLLGRTRLVTDYFDFVRSSQRKDGNIPFAIFTGDTRPGETYLRGMKYPDDLFTFSPPKREGLPESSQKTRQWIGLFTHWEINSDPLSTLGPICYILTAAEIYDATHDAEWLNERLPSIESAARFVAGKTAANGLVGGSGFYTELPPRWGYDGVTQCYAVHAYRELARILLALGKKREALVWTEVADRLAKRFVAGFWHEDHFAEYIHLELGIVDSHGLSDTNWAAIAFGLADDKQLKVLWPRLMSDPGFWVGGVPTQSVTKPYSYETWEDDPVPFGIPSTHNDVAAMGRVWYLEALACRRMGTHDRIIDSARKVSRIAKDGFWRERYHPQPDGTAKPDGANKYCEYPAVLIRVVLGDAKTFG